MKLPGTFVAARLYFSPAWNRALRANLFRLCSLTLLCALIFGCGGSTNPGSPVSAHATIAFASSGSLDGSSSFSIGAENIWVANADGSGATPMTRLTSGGVGVDNLVWSPDGSKFAFISARALDGSDAPNTNFTTNLWMMNADGSGLTPLTRLTTTNGQGVLDLAWSPDGRHIAFDSERALDGSDAMDPNGRINIWVANSNGTGIVPLTHFKIANATSPVWSPDGSTIAFDSSAALDGTDTGFIPNIWLMNPDGSAAAPVTRLNGAFSAHPSFSPDGSRLAFLSNRAPDGSDIDTTAGNLWVIQVDGSGAVPLTRYSALNGGSGFNGLWSPDGRKLAFESNAALDGSDALNLNSTANVWVANTDGSGAVPLTHLAYSAVSTFGAIPYGWSPDGASLAFISDVSLSNSKTPSFMNAWLIKADGSSSKPLTTAGGGSPAWKP